MICPLCQAKMTQESIFIDVHYYPSLNYECFTCFVGFYDGNFRPSLYLDNHSSHFAILKYQTDRLNRMKAFL